MTLKALLAPLFFLLTSLTGVCPQKAAVTCVKAGEMVVLRCPHGGKSDARVIWTGHTTQEMDLTRSAEQRQMGVLVHEKSLVILNASVNHQGNYSCSLGNGSMPIWFKLMVYTTQTSECRAEYPQWCFTQESCYFRCPEVNIPAGNTPDITNNGIIWHKEGEQLPKPGYMSNVKEDDGGVYTCTRSYLYHGQIYKMTFTVVIEVHQNSGLKDPPRIIEPRMDQEFLVDLGLPKVIDCKAEGSSEFDEVYWLNVRQDKTLPVFYNFTSVSLNHEKRRLTASLVFKKVSEEDLLKNYTCKLETDSKQSSVTITLAQKPRPSYVSLGLGVICFVSVMVVTVVIYVKFKINIILFLRDTLGCHSSASDGKSYDAFLMCYKSDTDAGLNEEDRSWLRSVLEDRFGYTLCLNDRDVLPGDAVAEAVLECIERSRTVVLVPTSPDPCPGSEVLSAIHEALVERQTRLVFIKTEATEESRSDPLPEALQLLTKAGNCVTWKGTSSMPPSSPFWKQLRYYLPAPQSAPKIKFLSLPV